MFLEPMNRYWVFVWSTGKNIQLKSWELYFGDITENYNLRGNLADSYEGLIQRGREGTRIYRGVFAEKKKWKKTMSSTIKRLLLITKNRFPKLMILVVFYVWEVSRVWAHWNYSFAMHLNYLGPVACFLHPESPQGVPAPVAPMT